MCVCVACMYVFSMYVCVCGLCVYVCLVCVQLRLAALEGSCSYKFFMGKQEAPTKVVRTQSHATESLTCSPFAVRQN